MTQIINSDTTLSGEIRLTQDIQIAADATLSIARGAKINGFGHRIEVFGGLSVEGTPRAEVSFENIIIESDDTVFSSPSTIDISFAKFSNSVISSRFDIGSHEALIVSDTEFNDMREAIFVDTTNEASFTRVVFNNSPGIVV